FADHEAAKGTLLWDLATGRFTTLQVDSIGFQSIDFSPVWRIAVATKGDQLQICRVSDGQCPLKLKEAKVEYRGAWFVADGDALIVWESNGLRRMTLTGKTTRTITAAGKSLADVRLSADRKRIIAIRDGSLVTWDLDGKELESFPLGAAQAGSGSLSPSGEHLWLKERAG